MKKPENHTINRFLVTIDMLKSRGGRDRNSDLTVYIPELYHSKFEMGHPIGHRRVKF